METVSFTQIKDGTRKEYELLARLEKPFLQLTADRVLSELRRAGEVTLEGYKMDLSRFDAAPLIAFTVTKETDYVTETDGRNPPRCSADCTDQRADAETGS